MKINQITSTLNYNKTNVRNNFKKTNYSLVSFGIKPPSTENSSFFKMIGRGMKAILKGYDKIGEFLNKKFISKIMGTKPVMKLIDKTVANEKFNNKLPTHLMTLGSFILSGFYIKRTLENDQLEPKKRKTLAINQAAVLGVSTVMCYSIDGLLNNKVKRFTEKFNIANGIDKILYEKLLTTDKKAAEKYLQETGQKTAKYTNGIGLAKSAIIFGLVYRYITPVLVTPIANKIGNDVHKKEAEVAKAQKLNSK